MVRKDIYHAKVVKALQKDGWVITDDPLLLAFGRHSLWVDLAAEQPIGAEKDGKKVAIEIKSFVGASPMYDLYLAIGQYLVYQDIMVENEMEAELFLAISQPTYDKIFKDELGQLVLQRQKLLLVVFDEIKDVIVAWIK